MNDGTRRVRLSAELSSLLDGFRRPGGATDLAAKTALDAKRRELGKRQLDIGSRELATMLGVSQGTAAKSLRNLRAAGWEVLLTPSQRAKRRYLAPSWEPGLPLGDLPQSVTSSSRARRADDESEDRPGLSRAAQEHAGQMQSDGDGKPKIRREGRRRRRDGSGGLSRSVTSSSHTAYAEAGAIEKQHPMDAAISAEAEAEAASQREEKLRVLAHQFEAMRHPDPMAQAVAFLERQEADEAARAKRKARARRGRAA